MHQTRFSEADIWQLPVCSAIAAVAERQLQTPHGGELVDLMAPASEHAALKAACTKSIELSDRNACDVELLTVGWDSGSPLAPAVSVGLQKHIQLFDKRLYRLHRLRVCTMVVTSLPIVLLRSHAVMAWLVMCSL